MQLHHFSWSAFRYTTKTQCKVPAVMFKADFLPDFHTFTCYFYCLYSTDVSIVYIIIHHRPLYISNVTVA